MPITSYIAQLSGRLPIAYRHNLEISSRKDLLPRTFAQNQKLVDGSSTAILAMIIRDLGVRHAGRALAQAQPAHQAQQIRHARQTCLRRLSTQPTTMTTTTQSSIPAIFTANVKSARRKRPDEVDKTAEVYERGRQLRAQIGKLGTDVSTPYRPGDVFTNPPGPGDVTLELLMASQAHMGHHTSLWNPANARYIYGIRQGIHIISLEQTAAHLRRAARVVEEVAYRGGLILFVGTRPGQSQLVSSAARLARGCHLFSKWVPGSITNSDVILRGLPLTMLDENDEPVAGYDRHLQECRPLVPDLVVCFNPRENYTLLHECSQVNVPTIGVVDTNTEPTWVSYVIPANDDSLRCLSVISSVLGRAGEIGHARRLQDAKMGIVEWKTPLDVASFTTTQRQEAEKEAAKSAAEKSAKEMEVLNAMEANNPNASRVSARKM
ncbi:37S ribosomal protein MRP4 [Nemania sp. FL0916]|nr:37S ribosomal protein MRP4 [Nemania sp. FL0916]